MPDRGKAFRPQPESQPLYDTIPPDEGSEAQRHYVKGHDGTDLYVETWLPAAKDGNKPPAKIPTVLVMTPYASLYGAFGEDPFIDYMVARGYAVSYHHVRGTGMSGGCLEQTSKDQIDDGSRVVEWLGKDAPWTNGRVGMYGASYDAETQISTAGLGDPQRIKYLKAIIPTASVGSQYDWNFMDGIPWSGQPASGNTAYAAISALPGQQINPQHYPEKTECQDEVMLESGNQDGDYTQYWREREYRVGARNIKAATLMVHGLRDFNVQPITLAGFFDRLPKSTPHKGLFGVWNHAFPDSHSSVEPDWERADWSDMVVAWFDRYLKGIDTQVEKWPAVQIQRSDGQWWTVKEYPTTRARKGKLALGKKSKLGWKRPRGKTTFTEQTHVGEPNEGEYVVFETKPLEGALHLTGQPRLKLFVTSSTDDAHIGAKLEVIGADGEPLRHEGGSRQYQATYGMRSAQHIERFPRAWFEQEEGIPVAPDEIFQMTVRFLPTDLLVPKGGSLRLTVAGTVNYSKGESLPSGKGSEITIYHGCGRASLLRFDMPRKKAQLLNVREKDESSSEKLTSKRAVVGNKNGKGLASRKICRRAG